MSTTEPKAAESSHQTKGLLRLTMACNEQCTFCNVPVEDYEVPTPKPERNEEALRAFVERGDRTLTISGGEPTLLRKRLLALVARAREQGIEFVELQTNAILIDEPYAAALARAGLTSAFVSLLSHDPVAHDAITLVSGSHERCMKGIENLVKFGIRVTLNPVIVRDTQHDFADFVDFVATRLPPVESISVSAVQPHGRAGRADGPKLLPDYAVLREVIPIARARARAHGIELLNPYCGVPLCIGWKDDEAHSVEAIEARQGGWRPTPGLENRGDKVQGAPCELCALRTRCGGAWRSYWEHRNGSGIETPLSSIPPWTPGAADSEGQTIVDARGGQTSEHWDALTSAETPTVWLYTDRLAKNETDRLMNSGCTDLAIELSPAGLSRGNASRELTRTLHELRQLLRRTAGAQPQGELRTWLGLDPATPNADSEALLSWARAQGNPRIFGRSEAKK